MYQLNLSMIFFIATIIIFFLYSIKCFFTLLNLLIVIHCLDSLVDCEKSFDYELGLEAKGNKYT